MEDNGFKGIVIFLLGIMFLYITYIHTIVSGIAGVPNLTFERNVMIAWILIMGGPVYYSFHKHKKQKISAK